MNYHPHNVEIIAEKEASANKNQPMTNKELTMATLNEDTLVGELVSKTPAFANVFEKLGIDYCCKGNRSLKKLCDEKNINVNDVLNKLATVALTAPTVDWSLTSTDELIAHIVQKHHDYLREELPRLSMIIAKVVNRHSSNHPELIELQSVFETFKSHILEHIAKEEAVVFPAIKSGSRENMKEHLSHLDSEHLEEGEALEKMHKLTNGYTPPPGACTTYIVMMSSLAALERDMHEHVHKETHILFPRAS